MPRGCEWEYVEELKVGKHTSHVRCKSCQHEFHGSATRIKEHLLGVGVNVNHCSNPPQNAHVKLSKYIQKLKASGKWACKKRGVGDACTTELGSNLRTENITPSTSVNVMREAGGSSSQPQCSQFTNDVLGLNVDSNSHGLGGSNISGQPKKGSLPGAFDRSAMLELHLKWTQAFIACGISFNVMRNPLFQDALMSTAKPGFVLPDYNKMRTEYLDKVKGGVESSLKRTVLDYVPTYGCTIAIDGWTDCKKRPLINIMCICPRGSVFLDAIDTSLKEKTSSYVSKIYERAIARVGGPNNVTAIVTDNASNYKGAGLIIQDKYPEITWVPCGAHSLNLLLKDIGKMSFVQPCLLEAHHVVKCIREHQFTYALFRTRSEKVLRIFCATRFATAYYVLERLLEVRHALRETVADRRWIAWVTKHKMHALAATKCAASITSDAFWLKVDKIVSVTKPFVELLRVVDTDKFVLGKVYWLMSEAIRKVNTFEKLKTAERKEIVTCAKDRWAMMHTPLHGAAFMLDPIFQLHDQTKNDEVCDDFRRVCGQLLPGEEGKCAFHGRVKFAGREGKFGDEWCLEAVTRLSPPVWWNEYGCEQVELQHIATRVLSVAASSGSCERNWSAYDFIHTKRRNRLTATRARDLVYCFCNMRLLPRPGSIATRVAYAQAKPHPKLTHDVVAEDQGSESEIEWEVDSTNSDMDEVDDIVTVLLAP